MTYGKLKNAPEISSKLLDEFMTLEDRRLLADYRFWVVEKRLVQEKRDYTDNMIRMFEYQLRQNREKLQELELHSNQMRDNSVLAELVREDTSQLTFMITNEMAKFSSLSDKLAEKNKTRKSMMASAMRQTEFGARHDDDEGQTDSIFDDLLREVLNTPAPSHHPVAKVVLPPRESYGRLVPEAELV
jgi:hypothetical protein